MYKFQHNTSIMITLFQLQQYNIKYNHNAFTGWNRIVVVLYLFAKAFGAVLKFFFRFSFIEFSQDIQTL